MQRQNKLYKPVAWKIVGVLFVAFLMLWARTETCMMQEEAPPDNLLQNPSLEGTYLPCYKQTMGDRYYCDSAHNGPIVSEINFPAGWVYSWAQAGGQPETRAIGAPYDYRVSDGTQALLSFCAYRTFLFAITQQTEELSSAGQAQGCVDFHSWLFSQEDPDDPSTGPYVYNGHPLSMGCTADNIGNCGWGGVGCVTVNVIQDGQSLASYQRCEESPDFYSTICTGKFPVPEGVSLRYEAKFFVRYPHHNSDLYVDNAQMRFWASSIDDWNYPTGLTSTRLITDFTPIVTPITISVGNDDLITTTFSLSSTASITTTLTSGITETSIFTPTPTPTPIPVYPSPTPTPYPRPFIGNVPYDPEIPLTGIVQRYRPIEELFDATGRTPAGYYGYIVRPGEEIQIHAMLTISTPVQSAVNDTEQSDEPTNPEGDMNPKDIIKMIIAAVLIAVVTFITKSSSTFAEKVRKKLKLGPSLQDIEDDYE